MRSLFSYPGITATVIAIFSSFGGWTLLLPVIPLAALAAGGSHSLAGLATGVFMGVTVLTQACSPWVLRRFGYRNVLIAATLLLGVPSLLHLVSYAATLVTVVAAIRGVGFGLATVALAALTSQLVPAALIGRSTALYGFAVGMGQILGFPIGLWIYQHWDSAVLWVAAGLGVVGALAGARIPRDVGTSAAGASVVGPARVDADPSTPTPAVSPHSDPAASEVEPQPVHNVGAIPAYRWQAFILPGLAIGLAATGFAAYSTFLAPASSSEVSSVVLAAMGAFTMMSRMTAGVVTDRRGVPGLMMLPGLVLSAVGVALGAWVIATQPAGLLLWLLLAGFVFGSGFGAVQAEALLIMFHRAPRDRAAQASAAWNMFFDAGTGAGAVILGVIATQSSISSAYWITAMGIAVMALAATRMQLPSRRTYSVDS